MTKTTLCPTYIITAVLTLLIAVTPLTARNLGSMTAGSNSGVTAVFGSGGEVTLNTSGITFAAGTADRNNVKWNDGNAVFSDSNSLQLSGLAGGTTYVRSNGDVALEAGLDSSGIVTLSGAGAPRVSNFSGLGSARFVCHDDSGTLYSSSGTCDGSAPLPQQIAAPKLELAALRAERELELAGLRAELRMLVVQQQLTSQR